MALGAIALSFATTALDSVVGSGWLDRVGWLYANKPDGARALLSTVAGSMITVAGVTFSITISTVVYASSQLGPRLLSNFMQDRGNQVTLGTFIATFLYCLLVLRTVRSADESEGAAFVPHIAILCGLVLALASLGVLIYFIHHTPASMHVSNVVAKIGRELHQHIHRLFPERIGQAASLPADPVLPEGFFEEAVRVPAREDGYLQALDDDALLDVAVEYDLLLRLECRPGDFVVDGQALVLAWPPGRVEDDACDRIRGAFAWGQRRTQTQDVLFLVNELVEVAARALSPGVNDPFTAVNCIDWLGGALARLGRRDLPETNRYDEAGGLRVVASPVTFELFAGAVCDQLRPYVSGDRNAALHMMKMLAEATSGLGDAQQRAVLLCHAQALLRACREGSMPPLDLEAVEARCRVVARLAQSGLDPAAADRHRWFGGSA